MIWPYFFKSGDGRTVTVNSERYGHMIIDFCFAAIEEYDLEDMWFQHDGANMSLLQETFPGRAISLGGESPAH